MAAGARRRSSVWLRAARQDRAATAVEFALLLPVILLTTAQPFGERVLLWCVAGISAEDLRGAKEALIAACWATDMRITASERHAHLVMVEVIRHHPPEPPGPKPERMTWPG